MFSSPNVRKLHQEDEEGETKPFSRSVAGAAPLMRDPLERHQEHLKDKKFTFSTKNQNNGRSEEGIEGLEESGERTDFGSQSRRHEPTQDQVQHKGNEPKQNNTK